MVIGVDFDNTIADYDDVMYALAIERGLIAAAFPKNKKLIRDAVRALPDGELHWRGLQVTAYGPRMQEARLIDGVRDFFLECRRRGIPVYIVSHKTEYANFGEANVNLRDAAAAWLERHGFFDEREIGLARDRVFFESTRDDKIARVKALGATHFIDDLEETFAEAAFPPAAEKILFAPHGQAPSVDVAMHSATWRAIHEHVIGAFDRAALSTLARSDVRSVTRIGRGGNSKVYRVDCADGRSYAAKFYFQRTMDGMDRLDVEFGSLEFLWGHGERSIPRPIAVDRGAQIALYEFVEGEAIDSREAGEREIGEIVAFVSRLRGLRRATGAERLPRAAEACFSFEALHRNIAGRLERLAQATGDSASYAALAEFLRGELQPALDAAVASIKTRLGGARWMAELPAAARTLSPSDFGFHNALRRPDASVVLLDLEYFGWDDPAKLLADFTLHPAMTLSESAKRAYVAGVLDCFADDADLPDRFEASYPLFAIKWCTILLNEFVPDFLKRREFALRAGADREVIRLRQLEKAKAMLAMSTNPFQLSFRSAS
jgi:hypothetical protein